MTQDTSAFSVTLFLDYHEDGRRSMEVYGAELSSALRRCLPRGSHLNEFRPNHPFSGGRKHIWKDRIARYVNYPLQARHRQGHINHIIDHGYAHLLLALDRSRTVITVHDLIPLAAYRGKIAGIERTRRPWLSEISSRFLKQAQALISESENTKHDLIRFCGVADTKIHLVPLGVSRSFRVLKDVDKLELRNKLQLRAAASFLILVSGRQFYKNIRTSLNVVKELRNRGADCSLIWLGNKSAKEDPDVIAAGLEDHVQGVEPNTIEGLTELYNAVDCLLFPSLYEGFGWPPLEAMACGTPVVCSNAASLPEVVGDAALVADPMDADAFVRHIETFMDNKLGSKPMIEKGLRRAASFSWERHALAVLDIYKKVLQ